MLKNHISFCNEPSYTYDWFLLSIIIIIIIIIIIRFVKRQNVKRLPWRRQDVAKAISRI